MVTCGVTGISPHWLDQITDDGQIVVPVAQGAFHSTLSVTATAPVCSARSPNP
ncbi:hypothetical protein ACFY97_33570 [Streptomyces klenkii]|uniref:hypothetical protein n=1 Tax=Streptomyces TaxID=1883 RepID=UPI001319E7CE